MPAVSNDEKKRLVTRSNPERAGRAAKEESMSSVDLGEVGSDNEEVTPTTTDNLPSSGDVNAKVVLLKARIKSLERLLLEKTTFGACL